MSILVRPVVVLLSVICLGDYCARGNPCAGAEFIGLGQYVPRAISSDGRVVVGWTGTRGNQDVFRWTKDGAIEVVGKFEPDTPGSTFAHGVSGDGNVIVGFGYGPNGKEGFRWDEENGFVGLGRMEGGPATYTTRAFAASDDGSVVVGTEDDWILNTAWRWTEAEGRISIGPDNPTDEFYSVGAGDVSADGESVIGTANVDQWYSEAYYWNVHTGFVRIGDLPGGAQRSSARKISADGSTVVGTASTESAVTSTSYSSGGRRQVSSVWGVRLARTFDRSTPFIVLGDWELSGLSRDGGVLAYQEHLWDEYYGWRKIEDVMRTVFEGATAPEGWTEFTVHHLSDNGAALAGDGIGPSGEREGWVIYLDQSLRPGDYNLNGALDIEDIDKLTTAIAVAANDGMYDLTRDQAVDGRDLDDWVKAIKKTWYGDANLDGEFNSGDFTQVFLAGEYEDAIDDNSGWAEGDWDGDADFTSKDMITAFLDGGYEQGPRQSVSAVPEPSPFLLVIVAALAVFPRACRHHASAGAGGR